MPKSPVPLHHPWRNGGASDYYKSRADCFTYYRIDAIGDRIQKSMKKSGRGNEVRPCGKSQSTYAGLGLV